jgi:RNA polymerase sigma factor (TIGR02999 family)
LPADTKRPGPDSKLAGTITLYLQEWRDGDPAALDRLTTALYPELRRLAAAVVKRRSGHQTIRPTGLVHDLYLRLPALRDADLQSRGQFLNAAAAVMRNLLVDNARRKGAAKRGSDVERVFLEDAPGKDDPNLRIDVLAVHELLNRFAADFPRQAKVVELKFFGGLTEAEASEALRAAGIESSPRTVTRDWKFARAWLQDRMESNS